MATVVGMTWGNHENWKVTVMIDETSVAKHLQFASFGGSGSRKSVRKQARFFRNWNVCDVHFTLSETNISNIAPQPLGLEDVFWEGLLPGLLTVFECIMIYKPLSYSNSCKISNLTFVV